MSEKRYQFSLGLLLYLVSLSAIVFAIFGPAIRAGGNRRSQLLLMVMQFGLFALVAFRTVARRRKVETQAGELIHRRTMDVFRSNDWRPLLSCFWRVLPLICLQAMYLWFQISPAVALMLMVFNVWVLIAQMVALGLAAEAVVAMVFYIDQRGIEFYENGYIYHGFYYQPWSQVVSARRATHSTRRIQVTIDSETGFGNVVQTVKLRPEIVGETLMWMAQCNPCKGPSVRQACLI